jgi:cyclopropane-fatty-acyl-phospholipid synthase
MNKKTIVEDLLLRAGVFINGTHPWDIHVKNNAFYDKILSLGTLGLGESFMDNDWSSNHIEELVNKLLRVSLHTAIKKDPKSLVYIMLSRILNFQTPKNSKKNIGDHYDIDDLNSGLYESFLDKRMIYTCGYWKHATSLEQAQEHKLHLSAKKLYLEPGMEILDIGCGWGGTAKFFAENYDVHVTGVTNSTQHAAKAREACKGLDVEIIYGDYTEVSGTFDRIMSYGMFEHVGPKNYRTYMKFVSDHLKNDESLFLLHAIGGNESTTHTDPWINKYIFPGTVIPSIAQIAIAAEGLLVWQDLHAFGQDYAKTLMAWYENFKNNWDSWNKDPKFDERFYRMWIYYLLMCAGSFLAGYNDLRQIMFSKKPMTYNAVR